MGAGYFSIGAGGNVHVHPTKELDRFIDLKDLTRTSSSGASTSGAHPVQRHPGGPG